VSSKVIGIDARELLGARTGVGRYLGELLRRWVLTGDHGGPRFVLYSPEPLHFLDLRWSPRVDTRVLPGGRGTVWEQTTLWRAVNRDCPDVFFAPAYTAPLGLRMPLVVTIHDISFTAHPEWFRWREGTRRRVLTRRAARRAVRVLTDSDFSRMEIEKYYGLTSDRIDVIPPGVTPRTVTNAVRRERLVLYAGSLFNRRRLPQLIEAFAEATRSLPDTRLVIVGDNRTWPPQDLASVAASHGVAGRTELRSYVSDEELESLYGRAAVFAFLSEYEGFGLTPLEALTAGVPVVVLDTPVAREVYGAAATYVRRGDIESTAAALQHFLEVPGRPSPTLDAAPAVLSRYSWNVAADRTLSRLEEAAG
jgi:glycosyltransferase involved in cell wall biosynthesis